MHNGKKMHFSISLDKEATPGKCLFNMYKCVFRYCIVYKEKDDPAE